MSKLRIANRFGVTPNELLNDSTISLKAKGLFSYLQSKPDDWDFSGMRIKNDHSNGRDSVYSGLKELENKGYLVRVSRKDEKGQWEHNYVLTGKPFTENPETDDPLTVKPEINKERTTKKEVINKEVEDIYTYYKEKIQKGSRLTPASSKKINSRLKVFKVSEIKKAIDNFSASRWQMKNNADKGIGWFCRSDEKMEYYFNMESDVPKVFSY